MFQKIKVFAAIFFLLSGLTASSAAQLGTASRPLSLGSAYVGLAENGPALFVNPAGLATIKTFNLTSMYSQPDTDVTSSVLGAAFPDIFGGTLGLGYRNRTVSNVTVSSETVSFTDSDILLSFAKEVEEDLMLAVDIRLISKTMSQSIPSYEGSVGNGSAIDLSAKYQYSPWFNIGLVAQDLSGSITYKNGASDKLPYKITVGTSTKVLGPDGLRQSEQIAHYTLDISLAEGDTPLLATGLEWWPVGSLALRLGAQQTQDPGNVNNKFLNLTAGLGLKIRGITIDYAMYRQGDPTGASTHYFSLGYVGQGPEQPKPVVKKPTGPVIPSPTPKAKVARKIERVTFSDLASGSNLKDPAELLATAGLLSGYPDGTFRPNIKLTREHFAMMLLAAKNRPMDNAIQEVGGQVWASSPKTYVTRKEAARLLGLQNVTRPDDTITRGEMAVLLSRTTFGQAAIKRLPLN